MGRKEWISIAILAAVLVFAVYRYQNRLFTETKTRIMMGTMIEISLTSRHKSVVDTIDGAFDLIAEYENKFSYFDEQSDLWKINNSDQDSLAIDEEFYNILTIAEQFYHKTSGKYDVTIPPLSELWHQGRTSIPPPDSIDAAKELVGFNKLGFTPTYLKKPVGMKIDLGSIAKGYIVDKVVEFAVAQDILFGHINAGGDIRLFGDEHRMQRIGIRHPRDPNRIITTLNISNKAIVTSGDYERFFEVEGQRYHHIINPITGYPVENVFSVTIIADNATIADVLSTSVFLMQPDEAIELIKNTPGTEGIIYYREGEDIVSLRTEGIKNYLSNRI